ncbi:GGDEF domain-containing protein [Glacieibacterium megasporae]|uniref:GGDEF domain-containing protein n=1 Tax=Glacieibacterium megasporae TaxID=2835787 RepID=UPI001C1DFBAF|nr:GGDEF domain-containing protein [Polymorphobacter megasporae]UAJ12634.1 GGDEF domain-containing protein [Polymorphobacter megasporae]
MRSIVGSLAALRPIAPFAALFVLLVIFAGGGMVVIAHEADVSDASRAREAVTRGFSAALANLDAGVEMNVATAPVAETLSDPRGTPASTYSFFPFTSPASLGYHGTVVLNPDGTAFAGTRFGRPWTGPSLAAAARMIAPVAARLPTQRPASLTTLRRDERGEVLAIAVANAAPTGGDVAPASVPLRRLAILAPVVRQIVPRILPSLGVEEFRVLRPGIAKDARASDVANAVTIAVDNGSPIVFFWRPREPGRAAIARWGPVHATLLLAALVMLAVAARGSLAATRALKLLANSDSLTGLANRFAFRTELDRRLARGELPVIGMIDLNGFKAVNDEYGHLVGDDLLVAVGAELTDAAGPGDFVARLGGDEFALISPSGTAANLLAAAFTERLARPLVVGPRRLQIGAAIGLSTAQPGMAASALMGLADAELYENKHALRPWRRNSDHNGCRQAGP